MSNNERTKTTASQVDRLAGDGRRHPAANTRPLFAIRDDDTCYFTKADQLEAIYGRLSHIPVSLAVTPQAVRCHHLGDPARFFQEGAPRALDGNSELTAYLRQGVRAGRYSVLLHGATHEYRRENSKLIPECVWKPGERQARETAEGKRYLEQLLGAPVNAFVPPGNAVSLAGIDGVSKSIVNVLATLPLRQWREFLTSRHAPVWFRRAWHQAFLGGPSPFAYKLGRARLLACTSWTVQADWDATLARMQLCRRRGANFTIAVHYWELKGRVLDGFYRLVEEACALGFQPAHCAELFLTTGPSAGRASGLTPGATCTESESEGTWVGSKIS